MRDSVITLLLFFLMLTVGSIILMEYSCRKVRKSVREIHDILDKGYHGIPR